MRGTANVPSVVRDLRTDVSTAVGSNPALVVRLLGVDPQSESFLRESVSGLGLDVSAHALPADSDKADVLLIDAESPDVWDAAELRGVGTHERTVTIVAAGELDAQVCELGISVDAVAYVKKGPGLETCAALALLLGVVGRASDTPPR
jgi:hypothetical protein